MLGSLALVVGQALRVTEREVKRVHRKLLAGLLVVVMIASFLCPMAVKAADPEVTITVSAQIVAITNTQSSWGIGIIEVDDIVYFSTNGVQDDDWSQIENTGNVAVDVEIQGTNIEGGDYDWTLAAAAGVEIYSLYANKQATPTVYDVEVKTSAYNDITAAAGLAVSATNDWSMKFTSPTQFNASDDGAQKTATVTLVASKHV